MKISPHIFLIRLWNCIDFLNAWGKERCRFWKTIDIASFMISTAINSNHSQKHKVRTLGWNFDTSFYGRTEPRRRSQHRECHLWKEACNRRKGRLKTTKTYTMTRIRRPTRIEKATRASKTTGEVRSIVSRTTFDICTTRPFTKSTKPPLQPI